MSVAKKLSFLPIALHLFQAETRGHATVEARACMRANAIKAIDVKEAANCKTSWFQAAKCLLLAVTLCCSKEEAAGLHVGSAQQRL